MTLNAQILAPPTLVTNHLKRENTMDARLQSDIAYIKEAVSSYSRHEARVASLDARIDRLGDELQRATSRIFELELFQTVVKGILSGIGILVVVALIASLFKAAALDPAEHSSAQDETSGHADATQVGPE